MEGKQRDQMPKPSVYVETTVISYLTAQPSRDIITAAHQQITQDWWEHALPNLEPYLSPYVTAEITRGDPEAAKTRLAAVASFAVLDITAPELDDLASQYLAATQIPGRARADALHLATAAWHGMEYLVSWNCTHIVSGRVRKVITTINDGVGIRTPTICTPEELMDV